MCRLKDDDVYIVVVDGGYFGSVTICEASKAVQSIKQLRQKGRKIKIFYNREDYLFGLLKDHEDRIKNIKLQNTYSNNDY